MKGLRFGIAAGGVMVVAACGGGGGGSAGTTATTSTTSTTVATSTTVNRELPAFASDFDRVCTTQVGFPGAASYEPGAGIHPVLFFEEADNGAYVTTSRSLPQGWAIEEDSNFQDNSELKAIQLIACSDRVKETPTGKKCEFDADGSTVTLELVDASYELKVYTATTGKQVHAAQLEAKTTECPFIATFKKGDTKYVSEPDDDAYVAALKPVVAQ